MSRRFFETARKYGKERKEFKRALRRKNRAEMRTYRHYDRVCLRVLKGVAVSLNPSQMLLRRMFTPCFCFKTGVVSMLLSRVLPYRLERDVENLGWSLYYDESSQELTLEQYLDPLCNTPFCSIFIQHGDKESNACFVIKTEKGAVFRTEGLQPSSLADLLKVNVVEPYLREQTDLEIEEYGA